MNVPPEPTPAASQPPHLGDLPLSEVAEVVFQRLPVGVIVFDRELRVVQRNEAAETFFSDHEQVVDVLAGGARPGLCLDWSVALREVLERRVPRRFESVVYAAGPEADRLFDIACVPLCAGEGKRACGGMLVCEDVTQRAGLERRLAVTERLAAVGRLAARVAHELNNPLDGALRYAGLALRKLEVDDPEEARRYVNESRTGLMRMAQIIGELLEFSRGSDQALEESNINDLVEEAVRTFQEHAVQQGVVITTVFHDTQLPRMRGTKLYQVCCNLIKNALDAMPQGGTLTIATGLVGREVVVRFEDSGQGVPEDVEAIFEPFYTTKAPGQGTGLGLAICRDYVTQLHGSITAVSPPEGGAAFTIRLPLDHGAAVGSASGKGDLDSSGREGRTS